MSLDAPRVSKVNLQVSETPRDGLCTRGNGLWLPKDGLWIPGDASGYLEMTLATWRWTLATWICTLAAWIWTLGSWGMGMHLKLAYVNLLSLDSGLLVSGD